MFYKLKPACGLEIYKNSLIPLFWKKTVLKFLKLNLIIFSTIKNSRMIYLLIKLLHGMHNVTPYFNSVATISLA